MALADYQGFARTVLGAIQPPPNDYPKNALVAAGLRGQAEDRELRREDNRLLSSYREQQMRLAEEAGRRAQAQEDRLADKDRLALTSQVLTNLFSIGDPAERAAQYPGFFELARTKGLDLSGLTGDYAQDAPKLEQYYAALKTPPKDRAFSTVTTEDGVFAFDPATGTKGGRLGARPPTASAVAASNRLVRSLDENGEPIWIPASEAAGRPAYAPQPLVRTLDDAGNPVYTPRSEAVGQRAPTSGGRGGLTASQQAQNAATADARRRILDIQARESIAPGQLYAMTKELDAYGRPNNAFRPEVATLLRQATRPMIGGDEGFEMFRSQVFGAIPPDAGQGEASNAVRDAAPGAPPPRSVRPEAPGAPGTQGGHNPAVLLQQARDAIAQGADPAAVAARLRQYGVDPSGLQQ